MNIWFFDFSEFFLFPPICRVVGIQIPLMARAKCADLSAIIEIPEMDEMILTCSGNQLDILVVVLLGVGQLSVDDADRVDRAVIRLDPLHHHEPGHFRFQFVEHELDADQREYLEAAVLERSHQHFQALVDVHCGQTQSLVVRRPFKRGFVLQFFIIQS